MMTQEEGAIIDLHRHLDGNVRVSTILSLAKTHNIHLPSYELQELEAMVYIQDTTPDLLAFLKKLDYGASVLADLEACERVAFENVEDAYKEGLHYIELRFSPMYMARSFALSMRDVVAAVIRGVGLGLSKFPIKVGLIGILSRSFGTDACMQELQSLLAYRDDIVALDLAGDELNYPAPLFKEHFALARKQSDWQYTVHAGEADGAQSIWDAIKVLGASRIGHGVRAIEDTALMEYLAEHQIGLECCLTSNYQTGVWIDIASHPVKTFLDRSILICLNTDDPGISNNTIQKEFNIAQEIIGLKASQCQQLKDNAIEMAFLSQRDKAHLKRLTQ